MDYPVLRQQIILVVIKSQMTGYVVYLTIDVLPKNHKPTTQQNLSSIQKYTKDGAEKSEQQEVVVSEHRRFNNVEQFIRVILITEFINET